jgi:hypothetical protein
LAASGDIQGLIAQGRSIQEIIAIARDVAQKLIELRDGDEEACTLLPTTDMFDCPMVVNA